MAITLSSPRKMLSQVLGDFTDVHGTEYCFATVTVENASDVEIDPIGQPVIWNITDDVFNFYTNASDISAVNEDSSLPGGAPIAIVVGSNMGVGVNSDYQTVGTGGTELYVVYRGPGAVKQDHIDWSVLDTDGDASVTPAAGAVQTAFLAQLQAQGLALIESADVVTPTYVS